jgi:hypothetical protein
MRVLRRCNQPIDGFLDLALGEEGGGGSAENAGGRSARGCIPPPNKLQHGLGAQSLVGTGLGVRGQSPQEMLNPSMKQPKALTLVCLKVLK